MQCEICGKEIKSYQDIYSRVQKKDICCSCQCLCEKMLWNNEIYVVTSGKIRND